MLSTYPSPAPLDLAAGETEIEEVIDHEGVNDWTAAMRDFVVMEASGTYRCTICNYKQYGTSALKRHVFPIHFKCYPYMCQYCTIGMTQVRGGGGAAVATSCTSQCSCFYMCIICDKF